MKYGILVTGGSGFIGQRVLQELQLRGVHPLMATVNKNGIKSLPGQPLELIESSDMGRNLITCLSRVAVVIHCAGVTKSTKVGAINTEATFREVNSTATLELARQSALAGVRRFILVSSVKVNGESTPPDVPFCPDDVPAPADAYASSKYQAEQGLMELSYETGMEFVVIRPPLVYGPGVKGNFASMTRWLIKGFPLPFGAVQNLRSLVAIDNLVDFLILCADLQRAQRAANEVFLVSDGEDVSTTDLLRKIAESYHVSPKLLPVSARCLRLIAKFLFKAKEADRLLGSLVVNSSKTRTLLGWRPITSMDAQLAKMARYDKIS